MGSFSDSQVLSFRICRGFAASLSVLGSSLIIIHVLILSKKKDQRKPKHRLLLGLSLTDFVFSLQNALFCVGVYPLNSPGTLCSLDGWIHTCSNMAAYYNASLSVFFWAVIRRNVSDADFARSYEWACHAVPLGVGLTAASTAVGLDLYNPKSSGMGCWFEDYPMGCSDNNENIDIDCRGDATLLAVYPHVAQTIPMLTALIVMMVCNLQIYRFVRSLERRNAAYAFATQSSASATTSSRRRTKRWSLLSSLTRSTAAATSSEQPNPNIPDVYQRSRKIATQSYFYVGAYFISYSPGVMYFIVTAVRPNIEQGDDLFPLMIVSSLLFPAQGFWNMLVYLRPQYVAWRTAEIYNTNGGSGSIGRWYALQQAIRMVPPPAEEGRRRRRSSIVANILPTTTNSSGNKRPDLESGNTSGTSKEYCKNNNSNAQDETTTERDVTESNVDVATGPCSESLQQHEGDQRMEENRDEDRG